MSEIDLLIKLFDTLKDSSKETQDLCRAMLTNQTKIGSAMQGIPFDEIKSMLTDHAKESSRNIDSCSETVSTKSEDIMEFLRAINAKITKMFIVFSVVVAVATGGYFLIRYAAETTTPPNWEEKLEEIEQHQQKEMEKKINDMMEELKKEINNLHPEKK
jgi:hypothetical protein